MNLHYSQTKAAAKGKAKALKNYMNLHYSQTFNDVEKILNWLKNYMNLHYSQTLFRLLMPLIGLRTIWIYTTLKHK